MQIDIIRLWRHVAGVDYYESNAYIQFKNLEKDHLVDKKLWFKFLEGVKQLEPDIDPIKLGMASIPVEFAERLRGWFLYLSARKRRKWTLAPGG